MPNPSDCTLIHTATHPQTLHNLFYITLTAANTGVETVTNLNVDLSVIPKEDLTGVWKDDVMFYECYPDVKITYHFATIQYQLYIGDKCYGDVQSGFEA